MRQFDRDLEGELKARDVELAIGIKPSDTAMADLQTKLDAMSKAADLHVTVGIRTDTAAATTEMEAWRAEQDLKPLHQRVAVDKDSVAGAKSDISKARSDIAKAFGEFGSGAQLSLGTIAIQGIPGAIAGLLSVADAAAKASHAVALIPAIGFAGGAGAAALATGIHGIPDALKDYTSLDKDPNATAQKQVDVSNEVTAAQSRLRLEQTNLTDTMRTESRAIRDMNDDFTASKLATDGAALSASEAAKRLTEVMHDPTADADTRKQAQLDSQEAIGRLTQQQNKQQDLTQDTARANALGVDGSRQVVAAMQQVTDAVNEVAKAENALKRGGAMADLDAALAKLSPNARALVEEFHSLSPELQDIRRSSQDALTNGLAADFGALATTQLPNVKTGLTEIDAAINTGLRSSLHELSTAGEQVDFGVSLHNTALGFENAAGAAAPLTHAMTTLVTVGTGFFPVWGEGLTHLGEEFDSLVTKSAGNGNLVTWIQEGDTAIKELGTGLDHVGSSVASVFRAAADEGSGLQGFDDWSSHISSFLKSVQGQDDLQTFFMDGRSELEKWKPVLEDIPAIVKQVVDVTRTWSDLTMPFLKTTADLLGQHPILLETVLLSYLRLKTVSPILDGVKAGWGAIAKSMDAVNSKSDDSGTGAASKNAATSALAVEAATLRVAQAKATEASTQDRLAIATRRAAVALENSGADSIAYEAAAARVAAANRTIETSAAATELAIKRLDVAEAGTATGGGLSEEESQVGRFAKLRGAAQGVMGLLGGPWGIAMLAGGVAVTGFVSSVDAGTQAVQRFQDQSRESATAAADLQKAVQTSGGKLDPSVLDQETQSITQLRTQMEANAKDTPGWMDTITASYASVFSEISGGIGKGVAANEDLRESTDATSSAVKAAFGDLGLSDQQLADTVSGSQGAFDSVEQRLEVMGAGGEDAAAKLRDLRGELGQDQADAADAVGQAFQKIGDTAQTAADSVGDLTAAMDAQWKKADAIPDLELGAAQDLSGVARGIGGDNGTPTILSDGSIDMTSQAGQTLQANMDTWEKGYDKATEKAKRLAVQSHETAQQQNADVQSAGATYIQKAESDLAAAGIPQPALDRLFAKEQRTTGQFNSQFNADTSGAMSALDQLQAQVDLYKNDITGIPAPLQLRNFMANPNDQSWHPQIPTTPPAPPAQNWQGLLPHAEGGEITGGIPGKDSVPLIGMPGEHMLDTDDVTRLGGQPGVYRLRAALKHGAVPHYDVGGAVTAQPASAANRAQQLEQYAQGLAGLPYGGEWDCSGLQSHLALEAVGLSPDSGRMSTANEGDWVNALGFKTGLGRPGDFQLGWINDPSMPGGGHTASTLPNGVDTESNGDAGVQYGGKAIGALNGLFNQHAYLSMGTGAGIVSTNGDSTANADTTTTQNVLFPQTALPGAMSDEQIDVLQQRAAVDSANSERNQIYADPKSTAADKKAEDLKYDKAANAYGKALQQQGSGGAATLFSAQGAGQALGIGLGTVIGSAIGASIPGGPGQAANAGLGATFGDKFGGQLGSTLAGGVLGMFGLDQSVLSSSNSWNQAFQKGIGDAGAGLPGSSLGYMYTPQNLPESVVTVTPQAAAPTTPGLAGAAPSASTSSGAGGATTPQAAVQKAVAGDGWNTGPEWDALNQLITGESSWNPMASAEPASDAFGLFQFLSTTWGTVGGQITSDPYQQAVYGERYIKQKYGDPESALTFWESQNPHWYDDGGIADGTGLMAKKVLQPERVLSPQQTDSFDRLVATLDRGSGWTSRSSSAAPAWGATATLPQPSGDTHHHYGSTVNAGTVVNADELTSILNRQQAMAQLGAMAAMPG